MRCASATGSSRRSPSGPRRSTRYSRRPSPARHRHRRRPATRGSARAGRSSAHPRSRSPPASAPIAFPSAYSSWPRPATTSACCARPRGSSGSSPVPACPEMRGETVRVSAVVARRLAITAQHLDGPLPRPTRAAALKIVRDIGYLQLDPTNVVARNPYLVLWSRLGRYDPQLLDDLLFKHRLVFEGPSLILPT